MFTLKKKSNIDYAAPHIRQQAFRMRLLKFYKEIEFNDDYNSDGHIFIKQDQPLPASILAIYPTLVSSDG